MIEICMLASGSSGNAVYVATQQTKILIDAGLSGKKLAGALLQIGVDPATLDGLLLSHDHNDHICGAGIMARRYKLPIYATEPTWQSGTCKLGALPQEACLILPENGVTRFGDLSVETFPIPHDAAGPVGFVFRQGNRSIVLATDLGSITPAVQEKLRNADCLVLEANHDETMLKNGTYPWPLKKRILGSHGHLSNDLAAACLAGIVTPRTSHVVLAHLSEHNNLPRLAYDTVSAGLREAGFEPGGALALKVAKRHQSSCHIRLP